jgi:hypothetical protein
MANNCSEDYTALVRETRTKAVINNFDAFTLMAVAGNGQEVIAAIASGHFPATSIPKPRAPAKDAATEKRPLLSIVSPASKVRRREDVAPLNPNFAVDFYLSSCLKFVYEYAT